MRAFASVRRHAAVVAAIATAIGTACFVVLVMILSLLLVSHSDSQVDARLHQRLEIVLQVGNKTSSDAETSAVATTGEQDSDDVPIYVWRVRANASVVDYSFGAPKLPHKKWSVHDTTATVAQSTFRFSAISYRGGWLVAGESLADVTRLKSILVVLDISVGAVLAMLMFLAAFVVGIRAQAPIALAQRRQHEFTSDASHELRTPLSVIEAEVDVALAHSRDGASYRATLGRIKDESHRLQRIVEDLLWLARSDEDRKVSLATATVDVAAIAYATSQRFEKRALAHGITLNYVREGDEAAFVNAPADAIDRLIGVLVDNACKFAGDGGQVNVSVATLSSRTVLRVDDSGPGIPVGERDLIFNRFQHSDSSSSGTGLGLAIAHAIITSSHAQCLIGEAGLGGARFEVSWRRVNE